MADCVSTGATGYIGGEVLHQLSTVDTQHTISCLVRGPKTSIVSKAYPNVRIVKGDFEDAELVAREARDADVVLRKSACVEMQASLTVTGSCEHKA